MKISGCLFLVSMILPADGRLAAQTPAASRSVTTPIPVHRSLTTPTPVRRPQSTPQRGPGFRLVEVDLEKEKAASLTLQEAPCRPELEKLLDRGLTIVRSVNRGYLVVGRVVLDGPGNPQDVHAQMPILPGGYFAGEVGDLTHPIGFRLHQFAPLDVPMHGRTGSVIDLGTVHMKPLAPDELVGLKGKVTLDGKTAPTAAAVRLSVQTDSINTPGGATSARSRWPAPVSANVDAHGVVSATGFSPMKYLATIQAPGYLKRTVNLDFQPGVGADLGLIDLEPPKRISLSYSIAKERPFDLSRPQQVSLLGGSRWKATPEIFGWDLEFLQESGALQFRSSYGPCLLRDLGVGKLEDFAAALNTATPERLALKQPVESGHVYLLHQGRRQRWIAFRVEVQEK